MLDVIIIGGGPAGLSAALILGRCRRSVLLCDSGRPRNWASQQINGFLSRDGTDPNEFRRISRQQLAAYPHVEIRDAEVVEAACSEDGFRVTLAAGEQIGARKLLLATGVVDDLPNIEGAAELYGRSVHHCPYCEGWEVRDQALAVWGRGKDAMSLALELMAWSHDVILCTDGPAELAKEDQHRLRCLGVLIREEPIARLEGIDGRLQQIRFRNGQALPRDHLFFFSCGNQAFDLAQRLGCATTDRGAIKTGRYEQTEVPGFYVAGDASCNVQLAIVAAAEGAMAAFAIHTELLKEDLRDLRRPADRPADQDLTKASAA